MKDSELQSCFKLMHVFPSGRLVHVTYDMDELQRIKRIDEINADGAKLVKVLITILEEV